ncbi:hypothetical protein ThrDRAFT_03842 [Frankia casuarinae]|nr:hypothetical protein ThrDRAFT_03842 [Frankia casuarinae]KDA40799.1 hypothetical protein BMG523Draft_04393 [Frankia sp. BMG5.23]
MERMSGGWPGIPQLSGDLPLRILRLQSDVAVTAIEELESKLIDYESRAPVDPLEYAALLERIENITEEAQWIKNQIIKITDGGGSSSGR